MANPSQNQNRPISTPSSNKSDVGSNIRKDEPNAGKKSGGMKDEGCSTSDSKSSECGTKSSKA